MTDYMKTRIALCVMALLWVGTCALWHLNHSALTAQHERDVQDYLTEVERDQETEKDYLAALESVTKERDDARANAKQLAFDYIDLLNKNKQTADLLEQADAEQDKANASSRAYVNSLEQQNAILQAEVANPVPAPSYASPLQTPSWAISPSPQPITGATIMHWYPGMDTIDFY